MKTILFLGGSQQQIEPIVRARLKGWRTVLCDYLTDNPGQSEADVYYSTSTTDQEAVLKIAQKEKIDGIISYASDVASRTAAFVAEKMGLPGHPYRSVDILTDKGKYRSFLREHGFATPQAGAFKNLEEFAASHIPFQYPVLVKPVDSSGSKGVCLVRVEGDLTRAVESALHYSRKKEFLVEDYVEQDTYQVAGDGFSVDGKLIFSLWGNDHFNEAGVNPFVPIAASFPSVLTKDCQAAVEAEIQRLFDLLDMQTGAYNFDIRIGKDGKVYLMEVGPRNGGNYIPQVIRYATGIDMVEATLNAAVGLPLAFPSESNSCGNWAYLSVASQVEGVLGDISVSKRLEKALVEQHMRKVSGDRIAAYTHSAEALGVWILEFSDFNEMLSILDNPQAHIQIHLR